MERTYISGGMVYDGTGKEPFCGDIVINGNTIEAVLPHSEDRFTGKNGRLILAQGLAVTPGFVDVHRHCDLAALTDPDFGRQELKQGITSVLAGNCGMGPAPSSDGSRAAMYRFLEPCLGKAPEELRFPDFRSYMDALHAKKLPLHVDAMVGTGAVRIAVKGFSEIPFSKRELDTACGLLTEAFEQGARAVSAGIMYVPECFNTREEWYALCQEAARHDRLFTFHIRGEGDGLLSSVKEVIDFARETGVRINISHFKSVGRANWKRDIYEAVSLIERSGMDITADVYPYDGGATILGSLLPPVLSAAYGERLCSALGTPEGVKALEEALDKTWEGWDNMLHRQQKDSYQFPGTGRKPVDDRQEPGRDCKGRKFFLGSAGHCPADARGGRKSRNHSFQHVPGGCGVCAFPALYFGYFGCALWGRKSSASPALRRFSEGDRGVCLPQEAFNPTGGCP